MRASEALRKISFGFGARGNVFYGCRLLDNCQPVQDFHIPITRDKSKRNGQVSVVQKDAGFVIKSHTTFFAQFRQNFETSLIRGTHGLVLVCMDLACPISGNLLNSQVNLNTECLSMENIPIAYFLANNSFFLFLIVLECSVNVLYN